MKLLIYPNSIFATKKKIIIMLSKIHHLIFKMHYMLSMKNILFNVKVRERRRKRKSKIIRKEPL